MANGTKARTELSDLIIAASRLVGGTFVEYKMGSGMEWDRLPITEADSTDDSLRIATDAGEKTFSDTEVASITIKDGVYYLDVGPDELRTHFALAPPGVEIPKKHSYILRRDFAQKSL